MKCDDQKKKWRGALFYIAFTLLSLSTMMERSALIAMPYFVTDIVAILVAIIFGVKILFDKHSGKGLLLDISVVLVAVALKIVGAPVFIITSCLAFLAMKDVDIKKVIKIDLFIKTFFLLSHALLFILDYMVGLEIVWDFIAESAKGTTVSLYFINPNTTGLIGTWIALDMLYLKDDKKVKDFLCPTLIAFITFIITTSRAPFLVYVVYLLLQVMRDGKKLAMLQKIVYPILCVMTFVVVAFAERDGLLFNTLNSLLSGRISFSLLAYDKAGLNLLPSVANAALLKDYIIDVFYVKCIVEYGIATMILYYLPHLLMPINCNNEYKRMSIITSIYLLFERVIVNVGVAVPYLIIADSIYNRKVKDDICKN